MTSDYVPGEVRSPPSGNGAYALSRWLALCRFLGDGRIELPVERAIRPIALGRKNHLFAGSDGGAARWAIVASLLATPKINDVKPFPYLKAVLERMSNGHPMIRVCTENLSSDVLVMKSAKDWT